MACVTSAANMSTSLSVPQQDYRRRDPISIRPALHADTAWIAAVLQDEWGGPIMWAGWARLDCRTLPALIAGLRRGWQSRATGKKADSSCSMRLSLTAALAQHWSQHS